MWRLCVERPWTPALRGRSYAHPQAGDEKQGGEGAGVLEVVLVRALVAARHAAAEAVGEGRGGGLSSSPRCAHLRGWARRSPSAGE